MTQARTMPCPDCGGDKGWDTITGRCSMTGNDIGVWTPCQACGATGEVPAEPKPGVVHDSATHSYTCEVEVGGRVGACRFYVDEDDGRQTISIGSVEIDGKTLPQDTYDRAEIGDQIREQVAWSQDRGEI